MFIVGLLLCSFLVRPIYCGLLLDVTAAARRQVRTACCKRAGEKEGGRMK